MDSCLFCKIVKGEIPSHRVYEDDAVLAFLDIMPVNPGHTLVIPKDHHENLLDLPQETVEKVIGVIKKITPAILAGVGAEAFNLGLNNGEGAGQVVKHFHWHIMPRFEDDKYDLWHGREYNSGEAEAVLEKIKNNLIKQ
jgi:histidine triad (HIT) family protein